MKNYIVDFLWSEVSRKINLLLLAFYLLISLV